MNGYEVTFKSGTSRVLYGETKDQALEPINAGAEIDCVIDIIANLRLEREFRHEHATLLKASTLLTSQQDLKVRVELQQWAESEGYIRPPSGGSGLALPGR